MSAESGPVSKEKYVGAANSLSFIAEQIAGIPVPPETIQKWKDLLGQIRIVDYRIDNIGNRLERSKLVLELSDFLEGKEVDFSHDYKLGKAMNNVMQLADSLPENRRAFFINSLKRVLKVTEEIKVEKDVSKFVNMTRLEGQVLSKIFLQFLPDEFMKSPEYQKLAQAFTRLGRAGNAYDTFVDLPVDYRERQARIKPTPLNRLLLLGAVLTDGTSFLKNIRPSSDLAHKIWRNTQKPWRRNKHKEI